MHRFSASVRRQDPGFLWNLVLTLGHRVCRWPLAGPGSWAPGSSRPRQPRPRHPGCTHPRLREDGEERTGMLPAPRPRRTSTHLSSQGVQGTKEFAEHLAGEEGAGASFQAPLAAAGGTGLRSSSHDTSTASPNRGREGSHPPRPRGFRRPEMTSKPRRLL